MTKRTANKQMDEYLIFGEGAWGNSNWAPKSSSAQSGHKKHDKDSNHHNIEKTIEPTNSQETNEISHTGKIL